jgi:Flp pilus assembly pilin Flp
MKIQTDLLCFFDDDRAQDVAEYAVLIAVVLLIVVVTASALGTGANGVFSRVVAAMARFTQ